MVSPDGASRSHSLDTTHSVGLLWTSDQPDAENFVRQYTTLTTDRHAPAEFEHVMSAGERPQTHALDRATTGTGQKLYAHYCQRRGNVCEDYSSVVNL
jgi:hypothetical protein